MYMVLADPACRNETDKEFGIEWPNATRDTFVNRTCPKGTGTIARVCYLFLIFYACNICDKIEYCSKYMGVWVNNLNVNIHFVTSYFTHRYYITALQLIR